MRSKVNFGLRKLPKEEAGKLRVCSVDSVRAYAVMPAPVYVFLRVNEKFLGVKGPLDFFTPDELTRLARFGTFFMPAFVDSVEPFRTAGRATRAILSAVGNVTSSAPDALPPAPFETSDAVLRAIGPLWSPGVEIEPYFLAMFADELCAPLPAEVLKNARDRDVREFDRGLLIAGTTVFLALHLGYCDLSFLNLLRLDSFERVVRGRESTLLSLGSELRQLYALAFELVGEDIALARTALGRNTFSTRSERTAQKLHARLSRIETEMVQADIPAPTIFGERGFVNG